MNSEARQIVAIFWAARKSRPGWRPVACNPLPERHSWVRMRWDMHDPVCDGKILYARYTFSYRSLLPEAGGRRAMFEGVAIIRLREDRIAVYRDVANSGPVFVDMNFAPERIVKILRRQGDALKARPELARHLA